MLSRDKQVCSECSGPKNMFAYLVFCGISVFNVLFNIKNNMILMMHSDAGNVIANFIFRKDSY